MCPMAASISKGLLKVSGARFPLPLITSLIFLAGVSPQGAELVPFRGVDAAELKKDPAFQQDTHSSSSRRQSENVGVDTEGTEAELNAFKLGVAAMDRNDLVAAKSVFVGILGRHPEHQGALINMGWIAQREKDWVQAESFLKRAQKLDPENVAVWMALGIVYMEQDRLDLASGAFFQVVGMQPKNARGHRLLGLAIGRKGWNSGAESELRRSLELEPDDAGAHYNLAVIYLQRNPAAVELARRHYYRAIDLGGAADPTVEALLVKDIETSGSPKISKANR